MQKIVYIATMSLLLFLCSSIAYSQDIHLDSLKKVLQKEADDTDKVNTLIEIGSYFDNYKESKPYVDRALILANQLNYIKGQGRAYNYIGRLYYYQHNDSVALINLFKALGLRQQTGDQNSIFYTLLNIGDAYQHYGNYLKATEYYYKALDVIKELKNEPYIFETYRLISRIYNSQHNYTNALKTAYDALEYFKQTGNKHGIAAAYGFIAENYQDQNNIPEWLKTLYINLKLNEELRDTAGIAEALQYLGAAYSSQGNDSAAIRHLLASAKLRESIGLKAGVGQSYVTIASIYAEQGKYTEAFEKAFAGLKIFQAPNMPEWGVPMSLVALGSIYEKQGNDAVAASDKTTAASKYAEAEKQYLLALNLREKKSEMQGRAEIYSVIGSLYLKQNKYSKARYYLEKSEQISVELNFKYSLDRTYQGLAVLDSTDGNYKQAYKHYKQYILNRDSINNEETSKKFLQVQMQHDDDLKADAAKIVQQEKDAEAKRAQTIQYLVVASLGILILAVAIIALIQYRSNKQKQQANIILYQQKDKVESTLSELKATQSQLIQSEKMASLGELTAGIAHEIQNPLNFVNNFSEVNKELLEELKAERRKPNAERDESLEVDIINDVIANEEKINHHGKRADAIVKGMLQHSQSSTGVKEPTDINKLADEYLRLAYHGLRAKNKSFNATLKTDYDESIGNINIIAQDIGKVMLNLYNNAFYAVAEKKQQQPESYEPNVIVSTKKKDDKILISVKDNGNGISQKIVDKIFQPFFTTKPTGQGTGLGLSLSYDIIKAHGGEINVKTEENKGTEFIITLPI